MRDAAPKPLCPVVHVGDVTPCAPEELDPLLVWLRRKERLDAPHTFLRGTALPDGRLDLCKQSVGVHNARRLAQALEDHPQVRHLLMGTDGLGDEGAQAVAALVTASDPLETVYLGCNAIGPAGALALGEAVAGSSRVNALWLKRNPLGVEGARVIAAALPRARSLTTLDLTNTGLGDEGLEIIADALPRAPALARVYLGGNGATLRAAHALAQALPRCAHLQGLYLGVSPLGDDGAAALAQGLPPTLRGLALPSCDLGPKGVEALRAALEALPQLERLDLGCAPSTWALDERPNAVGDEGALHLASWLAQDPPLRELHLEENGLTTLSALALLAVMPRNTHLSELRLGKNIARKVRRRLNAALERNAALHPPREVPAEVRAILSVYR
jgi:Ran GTPase-activating protein (RanGAP) involved in mRNA processing and transport